MTRCTHKQHREEDDRPEERDGKTEDQLRVGEEDQAGPGPGHVLDGLVLQVRHVAEDGEHEHAGRQAGARVDHAGDQGVPERRAGEEVRERRAKYPFGESKIRRRRISNGPDVAGRPKVV